MTEEAVGSVSTNLECNKSDYDGRRKSRVVYTVLPLMICLFFISNTPSSIYLVLQSHRRHVDRFTRTLRSPSFTQRLNFFPSSICAAAAVAKCCRAGNRRWLSRFPIRGRFFAFSHALVVFCPFKSTDTLYWSQPLSTRGVRLFIGSCGTESLGRADIARVWR